MVLPLKDRSVTLRVLVFIVILGVCWLPLVGISHFWLRTIPNQSSFWAMGLLAILFLWQVPWWYRRVYHCPKPWKRLGLVRTRQGGLEYLQGWHCHGLCFLGLMLLETSWGWLRWTGIPPGFPRIALEGLLVAWGVSFAEELFFRGWLLDELERDYTPTVALGLNALVYGLLHFLKPLSEILRTWPTLPGLVLLGLILVWGKRSCQGRLGFPIGLHAGLVWGSYVIHQGQLVDYTGRVPVWITGLDENPLAGLAGLACLGILGFWVRYGVKPG